VGDQPLIWRLAPILRAHPDLSRQADALLAELPRRHLVSAGSAMAFGRQLRRAADDTRPAYDRHR